MLINIYVKACGIAHKQTATYLVQTSLSLHVEQQNHEGDAEGENVGLNGVRLLGPHFRRVEP